MIVVLVWMARSHRLYDLFSFFWHWVGVIGMGLGWEMFIICMGYGD